MGISDKIETIAKEIYGAGSVSYSPAAKKAIAKITEMGFGDLPVCMAKTQYSLSDDQKKLGRPEGFDLTVRDAYVCAGAGFVVALTGSIMTMPGLPKKPAADNIDVDENGKMTIQLHSVFLITMQKYHILTEFENYWETILSWTAKKRLS